MADGEKSKKPHDPSDERFKYIGFDVFPGKAGNMFKSDDERKSWVEKVKAKLARSQGEVRDRCTLIETRVSKVEKLFLTLAAVVMIAGLFIPWFSGYIPVSYNELGSFGEYTFFYSSKDDEAGIRDLAQVMKQKHDRRYTAGQEAAANAPASPPPTEETAETDPAATAAEGEIAGEGQEIQPPQMPAGGPESADQVPAVINVVFVNTPQIDQIHGMNDLRQHVVATFSYDAATGREKMDYGSSRAISVLPEMLTLRAQQIDSISAAVTDSLKAAADQRMAAGDSTISADSIFYAGPVLVEDKVVAELAMKGIINDSYSITGLGALASIGTYGSMIFSSGIVLVITGVLLIVYFLLCVVMAILNLYLLYGARKKAQEDQYAIYLKRMLRYNWIPVIIWLAMFFLSFAGASYGFNSSGMLRQIGDSYGIASFIGLSSFGIYVTLAAFLIAALKGKEI